MIIFWHVDELKISHRDEEMISALAIELAEEFGSKTTISTGKIHDYLGIDLDFEIKRGTLIISQINYLQKILEEFLEVLTRSTACPAGNHIFKMREDKDREILGEEMAKQFHRTARESDLTLRRWYFFSPLGLRNLTRTIGGSCGMVLCT